MTNAEAIETLRANYPDACFEQLREAVDKAIKALEEPKWIPCSERLPVENQICIVTDETMRNTYEYRFSKETYDATQGWTYLRRRIIAWMPLPEPYREEK